jgi:raffinose/stachyose/melibiose transport system permease protein
MSIARTPGGSRAVRRPQGFLWILPALVVSVAVVYYCIGYTGYISTLDWNGISPNPDQVGVGNYIDLFADPVFWGTIGRTAVFFIATFVLQTGLGFVWAAILHSGLFLSRLYKVFVFVPLVIAPAIMAPVFREVYAADGVFNGILGSVGLGFLEQPWLAQSLTAFPVVISIQVWQFTGLAFILYYAAMSQLDQEVLEAARVDGAGNLRTLISIVWPQMKGTTVALAIVTAINSLKNFDVPYLVTSGGPNFATEFLATMIYRQSIPLGNVGYAAAISIVLLVLAVSSGIILQRSGRERARKA